MENAFRKKLAAELINLPVEQIMTRWPETVSTFVAYRLHCIGCPIALFHTISDAADEHHVIYEDLKTAILKAIISKRTDTA